MCGDARAENARAYCGGWQPLLCTSNESGLNVRLHVLWKYLFCIRINVGTKIVQNVLETEKNVRNWKETKIWLDSRILTSILEGFL